MQFLAICSEERIPEYSTSRGISIIGDIFVSPVKTSGFSISFQSVEKSFLFSIGSTVRGQALHYKDLRAKDIIYCVDSEKSFVPKGLEGISVKQDYFSVMWEIVLLLIFNMYHILPFQYKRLPLCSNALSPHQQNTTRTNFR